MAASPQRPNVSVTVNDNDTAGVSVSPTSLSVEEGGTTTYTVVLNTEPTTVSRAAR